MKPIWKKLTAAVLLFAAGYLACFYRDSFIINQLHSDVKNASDASYDYFSTLGFRTDGSGPRLKALWIENLRPQLEADLKRPFDPQWEGVNNAWGTAYLVLKDNAGKQSWNYRPDMDQSAQDEMIRYLLFRIRKATDFPQLLWTENGSDEFAALRTYPAATLARHQRELKALLTSVLERRGEVRPLTREAEEFTTNELSQKWAQDLWWSFFRQYASLNYSLPWWDLGDLVLYRAESKTASPVRDGAQSMMQRLRAINWTEKYYEQDIPQEAGKRIDTWLKIHPAMAPATSPK